MKQRIATVVSRIFDPIIEGPALIWFASSLSSPNHSLILIFLLSFSLIYLLPTLFFLIFLRKGIISDWDISQRQERERIFQLTLACILGCLLVLTVIGETQTTLFYLKILIPVFIFFLTSHFYKISGHVFVNTIFILFLYFYTNSTVVLYLGLLIIIAVGWARMVLKKHSLVQVLTGGLLGLLILGLL